MQCHACYYVMRSAVLFWTHAQHTIHHLLFYETN